MSEPGWKKTLVQSLEAHNTLAYSKYFQIATVRPNGSPANRTVVFRGFLGDTENITFVADGKSAKVEEITNNPLGEICWYFTNTREQYRISGLLKAVDETTEDGNFLKARQMTWQNLSDNGKAQFLEPPPGLAREPYDENKQDTPPTKDEQIPAQFCLIVLQPQEVDYSRVSTNVHIQYKLEQGFWKKLGSDP
eukprot:TRINITY_DN28303_c0_g1_i4.p3 TRINITY_DN28303_c0_g1~~TRINITY_DN28303_c0_g1_i4.p3  ORF type:complete len:193 (-),score=19.74 TRINITY_DN28303_c0_g1_i4:388-966(-)